MSYGIVKSDYYSGTTITMNPEDVGFKYDGEFFENSKKGLKDIIKLIFNHYYPSLTMTKRTYLSDEENSRMKEQYYNSLKKVVWSDYPNLRGVPDYHENLKAYDSSRTFKNIWVDKKSKKAWLGEKKINTEVKRDINEFIKDLGKHIVINSVELITTHYVSCNDCFARINFTEIDDFKSIENLRNEQAEKEAAAENAKKIAEEKIQQEKIAAKNAAIEKIGKTYYGKYMKSQNREFSNSIINDFICGNITEKYLNAVSAEELFNADNINNKDYQRIIGILEKATTKPYNTNDPLVLKINEWKACDLALNMNNKIKNEEKRINRRNAAIDLGVKFIANCFK
jgi:hypothetical protein